MHAAISNVARAVLIGCFAFALAGCSVPAGDEESIGSAEEAGSTEGHNGVSAVVLAQRHLKVAILQSYNISTVNDTRPMALCGPNRWSNGCQLATEWNNWVATMPTERGTNLLTGIIHCALPTSYSIVVPALGNASIPGMFGFVPTHNTAKLEGYQQEIISGCVTALINANNVQVPIGIVGPFATPPLDDPSFSYMEAVYYAELYQPVPYAIACGGIKDTGGDIVVGRVLRVCGDAGNPCLIHVPGACNGGYVPDQSGYCKQWASAAGVSYCAVARDDGQYSYRYPSTVYLKTRPPIATGGLTRCGWDENQACPP